MGKNLSKCAQARMTWVVQWWDDIAIGIALCRLDYLVYFNTTAFLRTFLPLIIYIPVCFARLEPSDFPLRL